MPLYFLKFFKLQYSQRYGKFLGKLIPGESAKLNDLWEAFI